MRSPEQLFGRFGNRLFKEAFIYAYAKDRGLDPYMQDYRYFEPYKEEIMRMYGEGIGSIDMVSIHVRRGDYVNNPFYVDLTQTDYYEKAIAKFPKDSFLVFSDDTDYCLRRFGRDSRFKYSYAPELEDFNLMASCKHNIIANSSFSYWAAYLNPNPNKIVIAPEAWYADGAERTVCPPEWQKL